MTHVHILNATKTEILDDGSLHVKRKVPETSQSKNNLIPSLMTDTMLGIEWDK